MVLAACGGGTSTTTTASQAATRLQIPVGPPSSDIWVAGDLPDGYQLVFAHDSGLAGSTFHQSGYRQDVHADAFDAELSVDSMPSDSQADLDVASGTPTMVRGHSATLATMTDEGHAYGLALTWEERSGLRIVVRAAEPLREADARLVAEGVQPVSEDTWQRLSTGTDPVAANDGRITPGMSRAAVTSGVEDGDTWQLSALLPTGYPVLDLDRRAACYELAYRNETTTGTSCVGHPSWVRIGRRIFLIGEAPPDVTRVQVVPDTGAAVEIDTVAASGWSAARFWITPLPEATCQVSVQPTSGAVQGRGFGLTGPLDDPTTHDDWARCVARAANEPTAPGAVPTSISPVPTTIN